MDWKKAQNIAKSLVSQMTVEEKISQLMYHSPAIERLGIEECNWWNEAAHGVARAGVATVFPQAIGMAATFHPELIERVAKAVSLEARVKYNQNVRFHDRSGKYKWLTFWTPNINIYRDPRWGRGQETFGEDPYLTSVMGNSYIRGLQGQGEFLSSAACAKHFAVHSGPESKRHGFNAEVSPKDLWETYLPAFEKAVEEGVAGIMGAYNRTNGEPCCAHTRLMEEILQNKWGFEGYYVSDCGAIADIFYNHKTTETMKEAAALALSKGCHLNCGEAYEHLMEAYEEDFIDEEHITLAAERLYTIRALLGEFEENRPFANLPYTLLDSREHQQLNEKAAREAIVLLKNQDHFLPLGDKYKTIAVVGPNGNSVTVLEGNYHGHASEYITVASGIRKVFNDATVLVADGSPMCSQHRIGEDGFEEMRGEGLSAASSADLTILCLGLDRYVEGEEIPNLEEDCFDHGDKRTMELPKCQMDLAKEVCNLCENVVVVVLCGSPVDLGEEVNQKAKAILHGWYPGARGGLAVAQLLKGEYSPSGKLPITFYRNETILPDITDYAMTGRTYRYLNETPLYPFGYGLSYATFDYKKAEIVEQNEDTITLSVTLQNTSDILATEKVQVYAKFTDTRTTTPNFQLCGLAQVECKGGETVTTQITVEKYWLKAVLEDGSRVLPNGQLTLYVGGHQPDSRSNELCKTPCLSIQIM